MEIYKYYLYVSFEGDEDNGDIIEALFKYFSIRRRSGGGECSISQVSSNLYCVSFKSDQVLNRVLSQEQHILTTEHSELTLRLHLEQPPTPASDGRKERASLSVSTSTGDKDEGTDVLSAEEDLTRYIRLPNVEQYHFLIKPFIQTEVEKDYPKLRITVDQSTGSLMLQGPPKSVLAAEVKFQESLTRLKAKHLSFPQPIIYFLKSRTPQEVSTMYFLQLGIFATLDVSVHEGCVTLHGLSLYDLQRAEAILNENISTREVELNEDTEPVTQTEEFIRFLNELNSSSVQVKCGQPGKENREGKSITLVGHLEDITVAEEKILKFLQKNSEKTEIIQFEGCNELMRNLSSLMDFLELSDLKVKICYVPLLNMLELRGSQRDIDKAKLAIPEKTKGVLCETVKVCWPGAFTYFSGSGQEYLKSMRSLFRCQPVLQPKIKCSRSLVCLEMLYESLEEIYETRCVYDIRHDKLKQKASYMGFGTSDQEAELVQKNVIVRVVHDKKVTEITDIIINPLCQSRTGSKLLNAAGTHVKEELAKLARWRDITITGPGSLPCRLLVHVPCLCGSSVEDYLQSTIEESKRHGFKSITVYIDANELHSNFCGKKFARDLIPIAIDAMSPENTLKIVVSQKELFETIKTEFQTIWEISAFLRSRLYFAAKNSDSLHQHSSLCEPAVIDVFSKSENLLKKAKSAIEKHYGAFISNEVLVCPFIRFAGEAVKNQMYMLRQSHGVNVTIEDGAVNFNGLAVKTEEAKEEAWRLLKEAWDLREKRKQEKFSKNIQWLFYSQENLPVNLLPEDNYNVEIQYMCLREPVKIKGKGGETYSADLKKMTACNEATGLEHRLQRTEVVAVSGFPGKWRDMESEVYKKVPLDMETLEYIWVERLFNKTMSGYKTVMIERIQNKTLWKNFSSSTNQEVRHLFYGLKPRNVDQVVTNGFFRPEETFFSGETALGQGIYFYVDASAAHRKCQYDSNNQKHMFVGQVETGKFGVGRKGINAPPPVDPSNGGVLYNSVVDSVENPTVFVVFSTDKAYPEYCITFTE